MINNTVEEMLNNIKIKSVFKVLGKDKSTELFCQDEFCNIAVISDRCDQCPLYNEDVFNEYIKM